MIKNYLRLKLLTPKNILRTLITGTFFFGMTSVTNAAAIYLNDQNISVSLGSNTVGTSTNPLFAPFNNLSVAESLANVIDAPSADAPENHLSPSTHVWLTGTLELEFDFGTEYDLQTLHFWNYFAEDFDVDNIDFSFFDSSNNLVGTLNDVEPALGGGGGNPIFAEDYALSFPSNVQFVTAVLTGTNNQVDFNNIGFTAELSDPDPEPTLVPEPNNIISILTIVGLTFFQYHRKQHKINL